MGNIDLSRFMIDAWEYNCIIYLSKFTGGEVEEDEEREMERIKNKWGAIPEFDIHLQSKKIDAICRKAFSEIKLPEEE